jgi:hypothetical protein
MRHAWFRRNTRYDSRKLFRWNAHGAERTAIAEATCVKNSAETTCVTVSKALPDKGEDLLFGHPLRLGQSREGTLAEGDTPLQRDEQSSFFFSQIHR